MAESKAKLIITAVDQTQSALNSIKGGLGSLQSVAATLGATLSAGAFLAWTKGMIDAADELNDLSARVGVGIKELAGYKLAAEQSGASLETVAKGIKGLAVYMTAHSKNLKDAGIQAKTTDEMMVKLADIFAKMPDGLEKTALSVKLFGKAGTDLIPMLNLGGKGLQEAKDKAEAYGKKMAELAPQADKFNDQLSEISINAKAIGLNVTNEMMPALNGFTAWLADLAAGGQRAETALEFLTDRSALARGLAQIKQVTDAAWALAGVGSDPSKQTATGKIGGNTPSLNKAASAVDEAAATEAARKAKILIGQQDEAAKKAVDTYKQLTQSIAEYQAQLDAQEAKQGKLTKADELAIKAKLSLTAATFAQLKPELENLAIREREIALQDELDKRAADNLANAEKETASIRDQVTAQQEHNETIGLTAEYLATLEAARIDEQIAAKQTLLALFPETEARSAQVQEIQAQVDALNELKSAKLEGAARQTIADNIKKNTEEWKRFTDDIESSLTDALMRGFEGGKDAGKNFVDSLKNTLKTAALKIVVQAIVNPVTGSIQSALTGNGTPSGGGSLSLLSSLSSGNSGFYSGFSSFATSSIGQSLGLSNAASFVGPIAPGGTAGLGLTSLGQGLQDGLPYLPAIVALAQGNYIQAGLSAVGTYFGGPIGGAIGSFVGGLFGGGREDPHDNTDTQTLGFRLSKSGVAGFNNSNAADDTTGFNGFAPYYSISGQTRGSGRWQDNFALPAATIQSINTAAAQLFAGGASLASGLGLDPKIIDSATIASSSFASAEAALSDLSDAIVTKVIPNIKDFQQANEKLGDTATRLVEEFNLTNLIAKMRGQTGSQAFGSGLSGRDSLVQLLGGSGNASSAIGSYYQNFYSDSERQKASRGEISATLKSLGINQEISTRDQFRALVDAQDLTTDAGRKMYASLIAVADAFAGITQSAGAAASALSTDLFKTRADYLYAQSTGIIPQYAAGGAHAGGWAMVGERGPELVNLGPARIYSNQQSGAMLNTSGMQAEIAALRADLRAGLAAMAHSLKVMEKKIKQWDGDGMPAIRA